MFPMESFMERQWEPGPWKGVFVSFPSRVNKKKQPLHFCKLLISRAENETRTRDPNLGKVVLYQLSYFRMACFSIASAKVYKKSESPNFSGLFCGIFVLKPGSAPFI